MSAGELHLETLRRLAAMPFLDRLELAAVSGVPDRSAYNAVAALERQGLVASLPHATALLRQTRRYFPTSAGLRRLAEVEGMTLEQLLRRHPVSARWRRILLERLDAVAVIYRLASSIAAIHRISSFRWYRGLPLDAGIELSDGRTVGVVRQGLTADRTGFAKRLWRLREGPPVGGLLLLLPDAVRLRHARRLAASMPFPALLSQERDVVWCGPDSPVWQLPSVNTVLNLTAALGHVIEGGGLPVEPQPLRATLPRDIGTNFTDKNAPEWLLPALLKPAGKLALDLVSDWLWVAPQHLRMLMGVSQGRLSQTLSPLIDAGLAQRVYCQGQRLVLTDRGLAVLARRDRASVGVVRKRWSAALTDPRKPLDWRNVYGRRSRQLLRNIEHTAAVHEFMAVLAEQARSSGWDAVQLDPPHRASRHFRYGDRLRSIHPDGFGVLRRDNVTWSFFLEWERRAVRPTTMADRLAPYLRYYSTYRPTDDHGVRPAVMVVFDNDLAASPFLGVARKEIERERVDVSLLVSHEGLLDRSGPLGSAWHMTHSWETVEPLRILGNKVRLLAAG